MSFNEINELENYEGSGFSNFLKDQSTKFIKKAASSAVEKAVNTGSTAVGEKFGTLIANKIIPKNTRVIDKNKEEKVYEEKIPIDSGYKIIKLLQNNPGDIRTQFNSI